MTVIRIPEQTIIQCDNCGGKSGDAPFATHSRLLFKRDALDYQGSACADASVTLDLCDVCAEKVRVAINEALKK